MSYEEQANMPESNDENQILQTKTRYCRRSSSTDQQLKALTNEELQSLL